MTKFEVVIRRFTHSTFRVDNKDVEQRRRERSSGLKRNHQLKSNFRATPEICSVHGGDRDVRLIMYDLKGSKAPGHILLTP
jgi:hypothetical protein